MAYIGRDTDKISNVEVLDNITFDGSSSYTLQKGGSNFTPSSANTLLVSIDGVVQAGNFTVSGSTIDFGTAVAGTSTCDFILHYGVGLITAPSDGTVTTAKLADSSVSLAKLTATGTKDATTFLRGDNTFAEVPAGGITEADMFRLTADLSTNADPISSNLERVDDATFSKIGTGMTLSSGIYTFPSTGLYYITMNARINHSSGDTVVLDMQVSSDSGSSYDSTGIIAYYQTANDELGSNSAFVNVTNASTFRVKFVASSITSATIKGNTDNNQTSFTFIRLGDSQ
jgi:hypothetical protein